MDIALIIIQVILLDGILSIDNAAALAGIAATLPKEQQPKALRAGIIGAYVGRGLMLLLVGFLLTYPWLQLVGAAYLLYLCGIHFFGWRELFDFNFHGLSGFWKTVILIEIADLAFSLDNVAAVVALSPHIWIIILGVCISIVIMRFAAQIFIKLIEAEPSLEHAAFYLIFAIAVELILKFFHIEINSYIQFGISMLIILVTVAIARSKGVIDRWKGMNKESDLY
jgi:tellurite resistance protein TerC